MNCWSRVEVVGRKGLEKKWEGQINYVPQIVVHSNYVPHVPHFVVQVWYKTN